MTRGRVTRDSKDDGDGGAAVDREGSRTSAQGFKVHTHLGGKTSWGKTLRADRHRHRD